MAKCTMKQLNDWNAKLSNGFKIDLEYFLNWGEKCPQKMIPLADGTLLGAKLSFHEVREGYRYTGMQQPTLTLRIWKDAGNGFLSSSGMGYSVPMGDQQNKKLYNVLAKLTAGLDDDTIMNLARKGEAAMHNPLLHA